jgi:hypothetical protein
MSNSIVLDSSKPGKPTLLGGVVWLRTIGTRFPTFPRLLPLGRKHISLDSRAPRAPKVCKATGSFAEPFPVHIHVQSNCPRFIEARKTGSVWFGHNICNIKCYALWPGQNRLCSRPSLTVVERLWRCQLLASAAKVRVYVSIGLRRNLCQN